MTCTDTEVILTQADIDTIKQHLRSTKPTASFTITPDQFIRASRAALAWSKKPVKIELPQDK